MSPVTCCHYAYNPHIDRPVLVVHCHIGLGVLGSSKFGHSVKRRLHVKVYTHDQKQMP